MKIMVKFSIITCTYNADSVLQRTVDSVAEQTYDNIEHIIVDGCSSDNTMQMVRQYESVSRHDVKVICEKDHGLYDAMNKGISIATGDFLVFLNAGDCLACNDVIEKMAGQIDEALAKGVECGVVYGNTEIVDEEGRSKGMRRLQPPETLTWRSFSNGMLVCHQSFYVRTEITKTIQYDLGYRLSADVDWCIRVMKKAEEQGLSLLNSHLTLCRYLEGGMSVQNHRASLLERFMIMKRHYGLVTTLWKHFTFFFR